VVPAQARPANAAEPSTHGQLSGELTNIVGETGNLVSSAAGRPVAGAVVGSVGETMYMVSGLMATNAAADNMASDLASASPSSMLAILGHGIQVLKGLSGSVSGGAGVAAAITGALGSESAASLGEISSAGWAISEGINALQHAHNLASNLYANGGALNQEQGVHFGQLVGSVMKLTGIGLSISGGSDTTATALQAGGSAAAVMAGSLNLYQKGYDPKATMAYLSDKVGDAASAVGNMMPLGGPRPNPELDSAV
jgi:hypothetical protein